MKNIVNQKMSRGQGNELLNKLEAAGLGGGLAQKVIGSKDNKLAQQIVAFVRNEGREIGSLAVEWQNFYQKYFNLTVDFSGVKLPPDKTGFGRVIYIPQGLTPNRAYRACQSRFECLSYYHDLDKEVIENDRVPNRSYAIRVRDRQEADEELKNLLAKQLKEKGISGITILERLIFELKYHDETGVHLDVKHVTLCSGSRDANGFIVGVCWDLCGKLDVNWQSLDAAHHLLRVRAVIS